MVPRSLKNHLAHARYAQHIANFVRVGHGGDGAVNDRQPRKLRGRQQRAFNVNVGIDKARQDVWFAGALRAEVLDPVDPSVVNNKRTIRDRLVKEIYNIGSLHRKGLTMGNRSGVMALAQNN